MFLVVTRNFPPDVGGMQILMGGLTKSLLEHGPTTMQVGFCVKLPCNGPWGYDGGKKNGYIESGYINIITN